MTKTIQMNKGHLKPILGIILGVTMVVTLSPSMEAYAVSRVVFPMQDNAGIPGVVTGECSIIIAGNGDIIFRVSLQGLSQGDTGHIEIVEFPGAGINRFGETDFIANGQGKVNAVGIAKGLESGDIIGCQAWASPSGNHNGLLSFNQVGSNFTIP